MSADAQRELLEAMLWRQSLSAAQVDAILRVADAYAEAKAPKAPKPPAERKPPAVHYVYRGYASPACLTPYERHGFHWAMTSDPAAVTCGHCIKKLAAVTPNRRAS